MPRVHPASTLAATPSTPSPAALRPASARSPMRAARDAAVCAARAGLLVVCAALTGIGAAAREATAQARRAVVAQTPRGAPAPADDASANAEATPARARAPLQRMVRDAQPPAQWAHLRTDAPAPATPDATGSSTRAGEGAALVNARHLGRDRAPRLSARTLRDAVLSARRDDLPSAPLLATPILPRLRPRVVRRAEAQDSALMGAWMRLQHDWDELKRALDVASIHGVPMARVPLPATDERLLVGRDVVWFDLHGPLSSAPDPRYGADTDDDGAPSMRVGPYLGGWGSALGVVRGDGALRGDVGMRLGLTW